MAWSRIVVLASAAALFGGAVVDAKDQPILITVGPSISFEPGNIRIISPVEPSADNPHRDRRRHRRTEHLPGCLRAQR